MLGVPRSNKSSVPANSILQIEAPHHWCQASIEKLAPWVWLNQSTVILWYLTTGRTLPEADARRRRMGPWDSEWSLRHMLQTLRDAVLNATINPMSSSSARHHEIDSNCSNTASNWPFRPMKICESPDTRR